MKILIDECLPKKLKREFPNHEVSTVQELGWSSKKNGELPGLMQDDFDVFVTIDGNMQYQHPLEDLPIGFLVLVAFNNKLETLQPLMSQAREALKTLESGQVVKIGEQE